MSNLQKIVAAIAGLSIAYVLVSPPGYEVYEVGDIMYDPYGPLNQTSSVSQSWIYEHDKIAWGYLSFELALIGGLWWGGNKLASSSEDSSEEDSEK